MANYGRKYGKLAYGKYSYDLWPFWYPIPPGPPVDIWEPVVSPPEVWVPTETDPTEIWTPAPISASEWNSATTAPTEIWKPVTVPRLD